MKLVDQDMPETLGKRIADFGVVGKKVSGLVEKIVEIQQRGGPLVAAPVFPQLCHLVTEPQKKLPRNGPYQGRNRRMAGVVSEHHGVRCHLPGCLRSARLRCGILPLPGGAKLSSVTIQRKTGLMTVEAERRDQRRIARIRHREPMPLKYRDDLSEHFAFSDVCSSRKP